MYLIEGPFLYLIAGPFLYLIDAPPVISAIYVTILFVSISPKVSQEVGALIVTLGSGLIVSLKREKLFDFRHTNLLGSY